MSTNVSRRPEGLASAAASRGRNFMWRCVPGGAACSLTALKAADILGAPARPGRRVMVLHAGTSHPVVIAYVNVAPDSVLLYNPDGG